MPNILTTQHAAAHNRRHQDAGADEINCTGLAGRINYVDRGDPAASDWTDLTLIEDGTWRDLDCSAIVPANARAIHIYAEFVATTADKFLRLRKNGNANIHNTANQNTKVANISSSLDAIVSCDAGRIIEYKISIAGWSQIVIIIRGWFI